MLEDSHVAVKYCPLCKKDRRWESIHCDRCGNKLTIRCDTCDKELTEGSSFCPYTGKPLSHDYEAES